MKKDGDALQRFMAPGETLDQKSKNRSKFVPKKKRKKEMTAEEAMKAAAESNSTGGMSLSIRVGCYHAADEYDYEIRVS